MKKSSLKLIFYMAIICTCLVSFLRVFANENEDKGPVVYKYQYNNIPLKQPTMTKSMQPAVAKYKRGDYLGAMVDLQKVVEKEENNTYAKYYLAMSYQQLGYKDQAMEVYRNIIDSNENYSLTRYSTIAITCIDNPENDICKIPKRNAAPNTVQKQETGKTENVHPEQLDDISEFILSGRQIHPAAMDKIINERMQRKIQADIYSQQQMQNMNQPVNTPKKRRKHVENSAE